MAKRNTSKSSKTHAPGGSKKKSVKKVAKKAPKRVAKTPSPKRTPTVKKAHKAGAPRTTRRKKSKFVAGKLVFSFGKKMNEGDGSMRELLGGKGANLAEMTNIGLPVPPGFTITTEACKKYYDAGQRLPHGFMNEVGKHIAILEQETGKSFGGTENILLVSVRSGAAASMPGMMDTILNLGLTDESVEVLGEATGNRRFAYDAYRRLINMFGDVVMGVDHEHFEGAFDDLKKRYGVANDTDVPEEGLVELCDAYKEVFEKRVGQDFPQNPHKQLELAIQAVFKSWNADRAISYRRLSGITGLIGTAVNVQSMVFGNMGDESGTGVAFTRNPSTGENTFYGEFLINAQGEDVVAGIRTPKPVIEMRKWNKDAYRRLLEIKDTLELHYREMQDIEFTIEDGELFMLQTRSGKRTGAAAVRISCDMVKEKLIDEKEALLRIPAGDLTQLLLPSFDDKAKAKAQLLAKGLPASPGAASGKPAFTAHEAVERAHQGEKVILVRKETSPEDVDGMHSAAGILTSTGGMTSHAAVVARGWGKCCVAGAGSLSIDPKKGTFSVNGTTVTRDDVISIDGATGEVMLGEIGRVEPTLGADFSKIMRWADKYRTLGVRTNADTPKDAQRARDFGAQGIGLCRTEHMFFEGERITAMREMILSETLEDRERALEKLLPYQREDFIGIFRAMKGLPVTIRLLDPPLHEFLPHDKSTQKEIAKGLGVPTEQVYKRVQMLHEINPMLGHRGCRLAVTFPEILRMQVRAIVEATIACSKEKVRAMPEIMIPLVGEARELSLLRGLVEQTIHDVRKEEEHKGRLDIKIGTMIEIPRACITAHEIAQHADFFSFGTNDLTQLTYGYSRDDSGTFLPDYVARDILPGDPFESLDQPGVGELVKMGIERGRNAKSDLKIGICGEHGGDPKSVWFCHDVGLDYVSCSPFRVPIARLAAAQAAIRAAG